MKLFTIPNIVTLLNLLSGCLGIVFCFHQEYLAGAACIGAGAIFDFLDGLSARLLNAYSEIGKQLDSLADIVTFGVLPAVIIITYFEKHYEPYGIYIQYIAYAIPLFSALRLAKFNVDTRQSESFLGLPTPANAMFLGSYIANKIIYRHPLLDNNLTFLIFISIFTVLLITELPLLSLKFKNYGWSDNKLKWILLILSALLLITLQLLSLPIIILLYILISIINIQLSK